MRKDTTLIFKVLSTIFYLSGIVSLFTGLFFTWNITLIISGAMNLLSGYAWTIVGDMWDDIQDLLLHELRRKQP